MNPSVSLYDGLSFYSRGDYWNPPVDAHERDCLSHARLGWIMRQLVVHDSFLTSAMKMAFCLALSTLPSPVPRHAPSSITGCRCFHSLVVIIAILAVTVRSRIRLHPICDLRLSTRSFLETGGHLVILPNTLATVGTFEATTMSHTDIFLGTSSVSQDRTTLTGKSVGTTFST